MKTHVTQPVFAGSGTSLMAYIQDVDGTLATKSDVSSITLQVRYRDSGVVIATATLTVSDVIFDSLQTDARWTLDRTGYNFRYDTLASHLPVGGTPNEPVFVRFKFTFTPASGQVYFVDIDVPVITP